MILADANPFFDLALKNGPLVALLLIILWGGFKEKPWWVFGWVYRDLDSRHTKLLNQLDRSQRIAVRGTEVAEALAEAKSEPVE